MVDEERGRELPQRVRGAARAGPPSSTPSSGPVLSEELRRRIQAAVQAERAEGTPQEQERTTGARREAPAAGPARSGATVPAVKGIKGKRKHTAEPASVAEPEHNVKPERTVKPPPAVAARSQQPEQAERAVKPDSAARITPAH